MYSIIVCGAVEAVNDADVAAAGRVRCAADIPRLKNSTKRAKSKASSGVELVEIHLHVDC